MKILIVTAEPFGGYHLEPLDKLMMADNSNSYQYLIPYPSPIQGNGLQGVEVTHDFTKLYEADRLIVTGGTYSAWTQSVAKNAEANEIPIIYTELAYIGDKKSKKYWYPTPSKVGVMSQASAELVSSFFEVSESKIEIFGSPQLDSSFLVGLARNAKDSIQLEKSNILIVSSVSLPAAARNVLIEAAKEISKVGANVTVRIHPREDAEPWLQAGITLSDRSLKVETILESTDYAVASTGSFNPMLYFAEIPTVSILTANHNTSPSDYLKLTGVSKDGSDILNIDLWQTALDKLTSEQEYAEYLFGTPGGSAERVLKFWIS
jgi:hypothetical protein